MKIRNGVAKKPPPIPNIPAKKPVSNPSAKIKKILTGISAIGR
jgi:hypothetical protein